MSSESVKQASKNAAKPRDIILVLNSTDRETENAQIKLLLGINDER